MEAKGLASAGFRMTIALGRVDISFEPYKSANKAQKAQVALGKFLKAREDSTIMLNLANEALHKVTLSVKVFVVLSGYLTI